MAPWTARRRAGLAGAACIVAAASASCTSYPPLDCGEDRGLPVVESACTYRVATWNLWLLPWPGALYTDERAPRIVEWLAAQDFDLVALQEVWTPGAREAIAGGLCGRYRVIVGAGCEDAAPTGLILLVREDRFRLRGPDPVYVETYADASGEDSLKNKGFMRVRLEDASGRGARLDACLTHLQADAMFAGAARSRRTRERQAEQLARFLARDAQPATPVLLLGDFNVDRPGLDDDGEEYPRLIDVLGGAAPGPRLPADDLYAGWLRAARGRGPAGVGDCDWVTYDNWVNHTESAAARRARRGTHLDYIFSAGPDSAVRTLGAQIHHPPAWTTRAGRRRSLSDHYPVAVTIRVAPPADTSSQGPR